jgi:hypothetical protein
MTKKRALGVHGLIWAEAAHLEAAPWWTALLCQPS